MQLRGRLFSLCNNRRGRRWRRALSCCAPDALWRAGIGHEVVGLSALLLRHRSRKLRLLVRLKRRERAAQLFVGTERAGGLVARSRVLRRICRIGIGELLTAGRR
jgi:hypothetical protein